MQSHLKARQASGLGLQTSSKALHCSRCAVARGVGVGGWGGVLLVLGEKLEGVLQRSSRLPSSNVLLLPGGWSRG